MNREEQWHQKTPLTRAAQDYWRRALWLHEDTPISCGEDLAGLVAAAGGPAGGGSTPARANNSEYPWSPACAQREAETLRGGNGRQILGELVALLLLPYNQRDCAWRHSLAAPGGRARHSASGTSFPHMEARTIL
ncbi:hypothetical protein NDU88_011483 [Pleurodeles waltl]|uniref:Uncharacterized protein n=1 Tax=Pleurodeles waltl TaxID=8319 RepID=A0AAV7R043_PLEWA|nr:hypothetical protein NDU88_011483 [Pleurodeles waltl]